MADAPVFEIPKTADGHIDLVKWNKDRPQREAERAAQAAKPAEVKTEVKVEEPKAETPRLPRSTVRELNKLRETAAEERGRRLALEESLKAKEAKPETAVSDDPEPQRKDFATDAEFQRAAGRWDARQEAKKIVTSKEQIDSQRAALQAELTAADEKFAKDRAEIPDWDEAVKELKAHEEEGDAPKFSLEDHPIFAGALASSEVRAHVLIYLSKHIPEFEALLEMSPTKEMSKAEGEAAARAQSRAFNRLEGKAEMWYASQQKKTEPEKKEKETAAERDAKLPKPSEAVAPRGGVATDGKVSMFLADGVTVNPAHLAQYEARKHARR